MRSNNGARLVAGLLATLLPLTLSSAVAAQEPARAGQPRLKIETFAPARAYAVGQNAVTLIATVRNVGDAPLAEGAVAGRLTCVTGLDYLEGDTLPKLPALAPNAVANYRWRVTPNSSSGALVAAFALEYPGTTPDVRVTGIQHVAAEPNEGAPSTLPTPTARTRDDRAVLENGRLRARIETTASNVPGLWLSARTPTGWRRAGVSLPLAEALSGEGGQEPWWEVFRAEQIKAVNGVKEASLLLTGGIGLRWRATITLTLRANSSVLDYDIRLAPLRPIKISGLRLGTLLAGDGSFGSEVTEELPFAVNGPNAVAAVRSFDLTVGGSWSTEPLFRDWQMEPIASVPGADYQIVGTEHRASAAPVELRPGALVDYHGRLYALTPSASARQAFNILVPAERIQARAAPPAARKVASAPTSRRFSTSRRALILRRENAGRRTTASRRGKRISSKVSRRAGRSKAGKRIVRGKAGKGHKGKASKLRRAAVKRGSAAKRKRNR